VESLTRDAALARVVDIAGSVHENALLILGESGMGKSRLLENAWESVAGTSVLVRANPSAMAFSLAGLSSVVAALDGGQHGESFEPFAFRLRESRDLLPVANEVIRLLHGLDLPPTLVLIDDLDRMDAESQVLIGIMTGRLGGTGVRIVATATGADFTGPRSGMPMARLSPFTLDQTVALPSASSAEIDVTSLRIVAGYMGGNPRVLYEQLRKMDPQQLKGSAWLTLPPRWTPSLDLVTQSTLAGLSASALEVLVMASLSPLSHSAALGQQSADAPDALEELLGATILRRRGEYVQVTDPRARTMLYRGLSARERREKHAELAVWCAPYNEHISAWHRSFGDRGPQAVRELLAGASWLVEDGRTHEAVEFIERALSWAEHLQDHAAALVQLCSDLLSRGNFALVVRYGAGIEPDPGVPGQILRLATVRLIAEVFVTQTLDDDEVHTVVGMHGDADPDGATSLLIVAALYRAERWELAEARALLVPAERWRDALGDAAGHRLRVMTEMLDALEGIPDRRGEFAEPWSPDPDAILLHGRALMWRERYSEARGAFSRVLSHPQAVSTLWFDLANFARIGNEIAAGEFRLARAAISEWVHTSNQVNRRAPLGAYFVAWNAYSLGHVEQAQTELATCIALSSHESGEGLHARALALRGALNLLGHDLEAAVTDLRQVSTMSSRLRNPTLLRHWADYVEACVRTGRLQEAKGAMEALEGRLRTHRSRWGHRALLRCRALVQTGDASIELFNDAIKDFRRDDSPYELGRTLLCLARRQDALGLTREGRRTRMSAVTSFERAGADVWATKIASGSELNPPTPGPLDQLSDEEREIARRVKDGQRTREIAGALHLSMRTIELRLTRIYRLLGVVSRAQLVVLLSEQDRFE
jgi:DNA-binding CsgD family transcriptional regulator/tetratricopeptide (TPR) repeat protein